MLSSFSLSHIRFTLAPRATIRLPRLNKGITLRGGFGTVFRSLVCVNQRAARAHCPIHAACPYAQVFSPMVPADAERLRLNRDIPRPFVIKPPLTQKELFEPGEPLCVELVLVGSAQVYFPYFFLCFQRLGENGLGTGRGRFSVERVEFLDTAGEAFVAFTGGSRTIAAPERSIAFADLEAAAGRQNGPMEELRVQFLTPVLLKDGGKWAAPAFGPLMRRLRDRIHALAYFYCGETLQMDFSGFGEAAELIESVPEEIHWVEEQRCSKHRGLTYALQGHLGSMRYRGNLAPFLPFLLLGEYLHVGKAATFGQGWYRLPTPDQHEPRPTVSLQEG